MLQFWRQFLKPRAQVVSAPFIIPAKQTMRLAIVVGHTQQSSGAVRVTDGVPEWHWCNDWSKLIREHDHNQTKVFHRTQGGGYSKEIDRVYKLVDQWSATASVELHFNASASAAAKGTETLTSGTAGSVKLANLMQAGMVEALGFSDRGLIKRGRKERGGRSLWQGKAPAVLLEPYFGSNQRECNAVEPLKDELAEAVYKAAVEFHR